MSPGSRPISFALSTRRRILPLSRLWEGGDELDLRWHGNGPQRDPDMVEEFVSQAVAGGMVVFEDHERLDHVALDLVRPADHCRFGHGLVG